MTQTRAQQREELRKQGDRLKQQVKALAKTLDRKGRLKLKLRLMEGDIGETVARELLNGTYQANPRQDLLEVMEDVLASFGKARAS